MAENEKVKSIFLGRVTRKKYSLMCNSSMDGKFHFGKPYISESIETESREKIAECQITRPPFEEKETVYIPEIEKYTTIDKVARGTDGSIYYNVTYIIKELADDNKKYFTEKLDVEANLKEALIKYNEFLQTLQEERDKDKEAKQVTKILYIEPTYNFNSCSIICYYGNRKYTYEKVTISNLEEMLKGSYYLGIDKESTLIYIDAKGIGVWIYDALSSRGYNIESSFAGKKVMTE